MKLAQKLLAATAGLSLVLGSASLASADTLPSDTESRTFATGAGGWTSSVSYTDLCVPVVTCAAVTNGHQASAGVGGGSDGYIAADFASVLALVDSTSTSIWTSPSFVYSGAAGDVPEAVRFDLSMRADMGDLISLGNTSSYRVDLVDTSSNATAVIPPTNLVASKSWTASSASIDPSALTIGQSYQIRITSSLSSTVGALSSGQIGYDNVSLVTVPKPDAGTPGTPGGGTPGETPGSGNNGGIVIRNSGSSITTVSQLNQLAKATIAPKSVKLKKNKATFKVKCPKAAKPLKCKIKVKGLAKGKKSKAATTTKTVTVKPGKAKKVTLKVKKAWVKKYTKRKKVMLKTNVKVGKVKTIVLKKVRVRK